MFKKSRKGIVIFLISFLLIVCGVAVWMWNANSKPKTYEEKVATFMSENAKLKEGQIVFLGDSITAGYKLNSHYSDLDLETYNRGISGDTADWIMARIQVSVLDILPSKIILMIGTNDINAGKSAEEIAVLYEHILELFSSQLPQTEVFCVSIIPQNTDYSEDAAKNNLRIQESNARIEALAEKWGYQYVNLYDELTDENGFLKRSYSTDGLHLGRRGYKVWTATMKKFLK
ncbi:MAG: hypothetical protein IKW18_05500 [Clostridia bacterium]|nr:hypothetical protein [Clostridia bacterium]